MEKFHNLPLEKQRTIINAALDAFGTNGYKKTSVNDIANAAGISKAMVFHYFGTKKDLYFYLLNFCSNIVMEEIKNKFDNTITDFFERITMATTIKVAVIKKYPATLTFLYSVYYETNDEVIEGLASMMSQGETFRTNIVFEGMDYSKFKDGVDVKLVMKMLMWMSEGFINPSKSLQVEDLDTISNDFHESLNLLKNNLYKEQYL
ncbi:MAG: TetR/AcrR family transcriptional regulator [Herbinix sp.]|nr:TetR/AcrR family transcriptional regulator [Herbinix sp.]